MSQEELIKYSSLEESINATNASADFADEKAGLADEKATVAQNASVDALLSSDVDEDYVSYNVGSLPSVSGAVGGTVGAYFPDQDTLQKIEYDGTDWVPVGEPIPTKNYVDDKASLSNFVTSASFFTGPTDAEKIQQAIDSGADVVTIPDKGSNWVIDRPIFLKGNQHLIIHGYLKKEAKTTSVTANVSEGSNTVEVSQPEKFKVGQWIVLNDTNRPTQSGDSGFKVKDRNELCDVNEVTAINGSVLTCANNWVHDYTTAASAVVGHYHNVFVAQEKDGIKITGSGTIDGNKADMIKVAGFRTEGVTNDGGGNYSDTFNTLPLEEVRGGGGITLYKCNNPIIEGIEIKNNVLHNLTESGCFNTLWKKVRSEYSYDKNLLIYKSNTSVVRGGSYSFSEYEDGIIIYNGGQNVDIGGGVRVEANCRHGISASCDGIKVDGVIMKDNFNSLDLKECTDIDIGVIRDEWTNDRQTAQGNDNFAYIFATPDINVSGIKVKNIDPDLGVFGVREKGLIVTNLEAKGCGTVWYMYSGSGTVAGESIMTGGKYYNNDKVLFITGTEDSINFNQNILKGNSANYDNANGTNVDTSNNLEL